MVNQTVILLTHLVNPRIEILCQKLQDACQENQWKFLPVINNHPEVKPFIPFKYSEFIGHVNLPHPSCSHHHVLTGLATNHNLVSDYYWLIEFDVEFTGNWAELLGNEFDQADLVTYDVRVPDVADTWKGWERLKSPSPITTFCSALQVCRISAKALNVLKNVCCNTEWQGLSELVIPSAIAAHGLKHVCYCRSYANQLTWKSIEPVQPNLKQVNKLWHPVKY